MNLFLVLIVFISVSFCALVEYKSNLKFEDFPNEIINKISEYLMHPQSKIGSLNKKFYQIITYHHRALLAERLGIPELLDAYFKKLFSCQGSIAFGKVSCKRIPV